MNYFLIIGLTFNLVYFISYCIKKKPFQSEDFLIAVLLVLATLEIINAFLYTSGLIRSYPHFLRLNTPFVFVLAPIVWLLVREKLYKSSVKLIDLAHFIPFIACIIYLLPLYSSSSHEKTEYIGQLIKEVSGDSYVLGGLRRIQQTIYVIFIGWILYKFIKNIPRDQQRFVLSIYSVFCLIWLIGSFRYLFWFNLYGGLIEICLLCLLSIFLVYSKLSYRGKHQTSGKTIKYRTSGLAPEIRARYVRQIRETLIEKKLFINPDLTLSFFSEQVAIPSHHLSQVFSQDMNTNFKELINALRVEEAKLLLLNTESKRLKIETIAFQSGFKSISGFNTSFKKLTGSRPRDYRSTISEV